LFRGYHEIVVDVFGHFVAMVLSGLLFEVLRMNYVL
jgi:hypothetical protein